jgi:phage major head subunit gpT-like protein
MQVVASQVLANGLRTEFADTYLKVQNRQADSRLALVMDLGVSAWNRQHEFAYFNAAPHMAYWRRGDSIPTDAMTSVQFTVPVHNWGRRVPWHKDDRSDDQTQSLFDMARMTGESSALLPERMFFDALTNATNTLPAVPLAPDGASFFATTAGGVNRFGVSSGNLLTGNGVASVSVILQDYYRSLAQFRLFQDGKGQPLFAQEIVDRGVVVVHGAANLQVFEQAFLQRRQGTLGSASGTPSNVVQDASRNVILWPTARITDNDWFVFLLEPPKKATFLLDRQGIVEYSSLVGDNNSDRTRDTGEEYVQWERRAGCGIALPYGAIKVDN